MNKFRYEIDFGNGYEPVAPPLNYMAIKLDIIFTSVKPSASVQSINLEWVGQTAKRISDYINGGTTGGTGIYECLPFRIIACEGLLTFNMMLELNNPATQIECDRVSCPILEAGKIDWFNDTAASFTFSYLASADTKGKPGHITYADYKTVPYALYEQPNSYGVALMALTLYTSIYTLKNAIKDLEKQIGDLAGLDLVRDAAQLILLLSLIAYVVLLLIAVINLLVQIINAIVSPKRYKLAMRHIDLLTKGCAFLGLNVVSNSIFYPKSKYLNATWMPAKNLLPILDQKALLNFKKGANEKNNASAYGYFDGTFKEFLQVMMQLYNAEIRISGNTLYFEHKYYWLQKDAFQIPNTGEIGYTFNQPDPHGTNAAELPMVYAMRFAIDQTDWNTLNFYEGTSAEAIVSPKVIKNKKYYKPSPGTLIEFPCALGKRKDFLTPMENNLAIGLDPFIQKYNEFVDKIKKAAKAANISNPTLSKIPTLNTFSDREGWLLLSSDTFAIPKVFIGVDDGNGDWEVSKESVNVMSAKSLYADYHSKNLATNGNQYLTYADKKFPLCCEDALKIMNNNVLRTADGRYGKFTRLVWDMHNELAENVEYRIQQDFTKNLTTKVSYDGVIQT